MMSRGGTKELKGTSQSQQFPLRLPGYEHAFKSPGHLAGNSTFHKGSVCPSASCSQDKLLWSMSLKRV